jgi:hypothetical protein
LEPIIAWVLVTRYYPEDITVTTIGPITLEGEQESDAAVVYPDGTVRIAHDCSFQTWKAGRKTAHVQNTTTTLTSQSPRDKLQHFLVMNVRV